jgi:hypothetical protein
MWVVAFLFIAVTTGGPSGARQRYELAVNGHRAAATITALQLSNHGGCSYSYRVAGRSYADSDDSCGIDHAVGSAIAITYVAGQPNVSTTGDARSQFREGLLFIFGAPTLLALVASVGWRRFARERMQRTEGAASGLSGDHG